MKGKRNLLLFVAEKRDLLNRLWVPLLIVLAGLLGSYLIYSQQKLSKTLLAYQQKNLEQQAELQKAISNSSLVILMGNLLDKVEEELRESPDHALSDGTIFSIAELSNSFQPYLQREGDSASLKPISPERGQLLRALLHMQMDSTSFAKVKSMASFAGADLRGADLRRVNLRRADLRGADLAKADLRGAILIEADLTEANLRGANLKKAICNNVDMKRANLAWADLDETDLKRADLNGANLTSAKLRKADLKGAEVQWAFASGAFLNGANLSGVNLWATDLSRADLNQADLSEANLSETMLTQANLTGVDLAKMTCEEEKWLEKLTEWQVGGATEIQQEYKIVHDIPGFYTYWLEKIEN